MTAVTHRAFRGVASDTFVYPMILHELSIYNNGTSPMTVTLCSQRQEFDTFTILAGEVFDERVQRFCKIKVNATGPYNGFVRRGKDVFWDAKYLDN